VTNAGPVGDAHRDSSPAVPRRDGPLTPKGEARRRALLTGVLAVLERGGPSAVTHRAVAEAAGVPLAAATYYFSSRDEMLRSALRHATATWTRSLDDLDRPTLADLAETLVRYAVVERASAVAQYEMLLHAVRDPALRDDAEAWYSSLEHVLARVGVPADRLPVVSLAVDGLIVRMLWRGEPADAAATEELLRRVLA
jgi:DNA-binding transcriptional regulator YbjK